MDAIRFTIMFQPKLLLSLTFTSLALAQGPAATNATVTHLSSYPPVGYASTETLQVNLANLAANATSNGTPIAASCTGTVAFLTAAGTAIGTATPFTATAGQTISVTLPFAKSTITGTRGEIRVVITSTNPVGRNAPPCNLSTSLETFDVVSGATHIYLGNIAASTPTQIVLTGTPNGN